MSLLKTAVIGVGYLGRFHAQKYAQIEKCELLGVYDLDREISQKVAHELQTQSFTNLEEVFAAGVQAVTIAASTQAHYELAKQFLSRGVHVHVEKPMTAELWQAKELCEIANKNNLKLQVGHVERFNSVLQAAQKQLQRPMFIECHRLAPFKPRGVDVDVVLDLMIHDLDVTLSLVNSPVERVSAVGTPILTKTYDIANARIEFASGAVANITASRVSVTTVRKFRVFQDSQYLSIDFAKGEVSLLTKTGDWSDGEIPLKHDLWSLDKGDALLAETKSFVDCILNNQRPIVSGTDGLVALQLAEQVRASIAERLTRSRSHMAPTELAYGI